MSCILKFMAHAPEDYPIYFSKYDISNGFWELAVAEWNFAYVLPQKSVEPTGLGCTKRIANGMEKVTCILLLCL
ncbi:hypothetical protein ACHAXR_004523 [Thalassiosira sp. AJA248-18]